MFRYIIVSITSGVLFGALDALINANPMARDLYTSFAPIAKTSVNIPVGLGIDLIYGFVLAGAFLVLYPSLPGTSGLLKGLSFAIMLWFFRVLMSVASQWMAYNIAPAALWYTLLAGLLEMLVLGVLYGLSLKPLSGTGIKRPD